MSEPHPASTTRTNSTAIFALIMALAWLMGIGSALGLVFGIVAARECNRTGQPGGGIATAAAVIGLLSLLVTVPFWFH